MKEIWYHIKIYSRTVMARNTLLTMVLLLSLSLSACSDNPASDNRPGEENGELEFTEPLWTIEENDGIVDLEFIGDKVVLVQNGVLRVLQSTNGEEIWSIDSGSPNLHGFKFYQDRLFILVNGGNSGQVISHDLDSGDELWRIDRPGSRLGDRSRSDGFLVFETQSEIILIDMITGEEKSLPNLTDDHFFLNPPSITDSGQLCSVQSSLFESRVFCQDIASGLELWHKNYDREVHEIVGTDTTFLFLSTFDQSAVWNEVIVSTAGPYTEAFDQQNGDLLWSKKGGIDDFASSNNTVQIIGDTLFVQYKDTNELFALHPKTGEMYWKTDTNLPNIRGSVAGWREVLAYTDFDNLKILSAGTGEILSSHSAPLDGGAYWSDPHIQGDMLVVNTSSGLHMFMLNR